MEYLGAWGTLIHEKNLKSKVSCQTPFKNLNNTSSTSVKCAPDDAFWLMLSQCCLLSVVCKYSYSTNYFLFHHAKGMSNDWTNKAFKKTVSNKTKT